MLLAINYHYIKLSFDNPHPGIYGRTPSEFETQLRTLGRVAEFVSGEQILDHIRGNQKLPDRSILITFDDGLQEQYIHALPVLRRLGIPALFFINTAPLAESRVMSVHKIHLLRSQVEAMELLLMLDKHALRLGMNLDLYVEPTVALEQYKYDDPEVARLKYLLNFTLPMSERARLIQACFDEVFLGETEMSKELYMSAAQIKELGDYRYVGNHTHDHLPIGALPAQEQERQIFLSQAYLETWAGYRPYAMSYPYGSPEACTPDVAQVARALGIEFAFTMEGAGNRSLNQPFLLARFDCNDMPGGKKAAWPTEHLFDVVPDARWHQAGALL